MIDTSFILPFLFLHNNRYIDGENIQNLRIKRKIDDQIKDFQKIDEQYASIEDKINELIALLANTDLDSEKAKIYQERLNQAIQRSTNIEKQIQPFRELGADEALSREEMLDRMSVLLSENKIDSNITKRYNKRGRLQAIILCLMAVTLIILGFAMIIMPAPPSFEIYTVFYFNENDGVTIMDLVSLLIVLGGVFLFVISLNKFRRN